MCARFPGFLAVAALLLAGCNHGGSEGPPPGPARFVLAVDGGAVEPDPDVVVPPLAYERQIGVGSFGAKYRLTTPANEPFAFDLVSWQDGAWGSISISMKHVGDGGSEPTSGITSLARVGIAPAGSGLWQHNGWISTTGDGFVRLSLQGRIERDQLLAVTNEGGGMSLIVLAIGERSAINQDERLAPPHPGVIARETIYSSDAWNFGLPALAISGDRSTVVAYEGDRGLGMKHDRYELRMQHDAVTGLTTGGGMVETEPDSGHWRDHEIAALHNVLVFARGQVDGLHVRLSFDRGATFTQEIAAPNNTLSVARTVRLVQVAMALDYSLALVYWQREATTGALECKLLEGQPVAFDPNGSPTWFQFGTPQVLHAVPGDASPLVSGVAWSEGGDLAIGYGTSRWSARAGGGWTSVTRFHCAVRRYGGAFVTSEVDREELVGYDPNVAVLGQGSGLRVFYAYEVRAGVRLAVSDDGGATFTIAPAFGGAGAHNPSVFARQLGVTTAVDVLYLAATPAGRELHHARWDDWGSPERQDLRLTSARMEPTPPAQPSRPTPSGSSGPYDFGLRTTQVNWLGYDATLDGDQIVVVYDEVTTDAAFVCLGMWEQFAGIYSAGPTATPTFTIPSPPPLAPGMTEPMSAVDPSHSHQLELIRIQ